MRGDDLKVLTAMTLSVCRADYANPVHASALVDLLDAYAQDLMGGGEPLSAFAKEKQITSGAARTIGTVGIEGSKELPVKQYISDAQGLAGRPDAVIKENGFFIMIMGN